MHLQTKLEEDAIVQIGKSAAIIKAVNQEKVKSNKEVVVQEIELTKEQLKAEEDRLKSLFELNKAEVSLSLAKAEKVLNNDLSSYADQYKDFKDYAANKLILIGLNYKEEVRLAQGNDTKLKIARVSFEEEVLKQNSAAIKKLQGIRDAENKSRIEEIKIVEAELKIVAENIAANSERASLIEQKAQKATNDLYDEKIKKLNELKEATDGYLKSFIGDFANSAGFANTFDLLSKNVKGFGEDFAVTFNAIAESAQEVFNFISNASQANFDGERKRLQDQYDLSIGFAGDNVAAKDKLGKDLEGKQKEIANRENKAKQKQALFNIAIDTAQGIVAALSFANIPLAIVIGALGAVQLAVVAAQKVPQYKDGTENHSGGLMLVNDGPGSNFQEKVITPDGKEVTPQGRNVLMNAPKGTRVLTHEQQIHEMLNERGISMSHKQTSNGMTAQEMDQVLGKHFAKIQTNTTTFDRRGFTQWVGSNGNRTNSDALRTSRTGFKV